MKASSINRLSTWRITAFFLEICIFLIISGCGKPEDSQSSEARMASFVFSRSDIGEVKSYKDEYYMHGLHYFYFRAPEPDIERLINWLKLKKHDDIPQIFSELVKTASAKTGWKFMWNAPKVYLTYYCQPFNGTNWKVNMLLVGDGDAVYITDGYLSGSPARTDDSSSCAPSQLK